MCTSEQEGGKEGKGKRSERGRREERKVRRREGAELVSDRGEERRRGGGCSAEVDVAGPAELVTSDGQQSRTEEDSQLAMNRTTRR